MLSFMPKQWREKNVRAICFDSCPPKADLQAFGGFVAYVLKTPQVKPLVAPLFRPYMWNRGITEEFVSENHLKMYGGTDAFGVTHEPVVPKNANVLVLHGR